MVLTNLNGIKIASYGIDNAVIYSGNKSGIVFENCKDITVAGIKFEGSGWRPVNKNTGIYMQDCENALIENVEACGYNYAGIDVEHCKNIRIYGCFVHECGFVGIRSGRFVSGKCENLYIGYCKTYDIAGDRNILGNHSGSGIIIDGTTHGVVEFCEATGTGWGQRGYGSCGPVGIWACCGCDDLVFRYCISRYNRTQPGAADGDGFDFDGDVVNSLMEYNYSYGNEAAGYFFCEYGSKYYEDTADWGNNTIRLGVSFNDAFRTGGYGPMCVGIPKNYTVGQINMEKNLLVSGENAPVIENQIMTEGSGEVFINDNVLLTDGTYPIKVLDDKLTTIKNNYEILDNTVRKDFLANAPLLSNPRDLINLPVYKMLEDGTCADTLKSKGVSALFGEEKKENTPKGKSLFKLQMDGLDFEGTDNSGDIRLYYDSIKPGVSTKLGVGGEFLFPIPWTKPSKYVIRAKARLQSPGVRACMVLRNFDGKEVKKVYFTGSVAEYQTAEIEYSGYESDQSVGIKNEGGRDSVYVDSIELIEIEKDFIKKNPVDNLKDFNSFGDSEQVKDVITLNGMGSAIMRAMQKTAKKVSVKITCKTENCKGMLSLKSGYEANSILLDNKNWKDIELSVESDIDNFELYISQLCEKSGKLYIKDVKIIEK